MMVKTGDFMRRFAAALLAVLLCAGSVFAAQDYLIPGGYTVGIELAMRGVLVVDVEKGTLSLIHISRVCWCLHCGPRARGERGCCRW